MTFQGSVISDRSSVIGCWRTKRDWQAMRGRGIRLDGEGQGGPRVLPLCVIRCSLFFVIRRFNRRIQLTVSKLHR